MEDFLYWSSFGKDCSFESNHHSKSVNAYVFSCILNYPYVWYFFVTFTSYSYLLWWSLVSMYDLTNILWFWQHQDEDASACCLRLGLHRICHFMVMAMVRLRLGTSQHRGLHQWYFWLLWDGPQYPRQWATRQVVRCRNHMESGQRCLHMAESGWSHLDLDTADGILGWLGRNEACGGQQLPLQKWRAWVCYDWVGEFCIIFHFQCNWPLHNLTFLLWSLEGSLEGSPVVTTIWGPWNEPYLRDLQGTSFVFDNNHDPIAALANKRM